MAKKLPNFADYIYFQDSNYPNILGVVEALKRYSKPYQFFIGVMVVHGGTYLVIGNGNGDYRCYIAFTYWSGEGVYKINCENNIWSYREIG